MKLRCILFLVLGLITFHSHAQPLIVNEVSQGPSGSKEYVELLVIGDPYCGNDVPCADLRGYILDDNNGRFKSGSGSGIAAGYIRFKNIDFWSCVPQGTLIVIYNGADRNALIPADDSSLTDGNCRLILPGSSNLFEYTSSLPTTNNQNYNPNTSTFTSPLPNNQWNSVMGMRGGGDAFQIRIPNGNTIVHAVSWGDNSTNTLIYFSGDSGSKVYSFTNNVNNDPLSQNNWTSATAAAVNGGETPGEPNNQANAAYIASINPNCGNAPSVNIEIAGNVQNSGCGATCTGAINLTVTGGTAPYTYSWSNGATTQNVTALCAGTYTVEVTDNSGCSNVEQFTIQGQGNMVLTPTIQHETCADACDGAITIAPTGTAPYTYTWSNGATTATISNLCDGIYTVNVTDNAGCSGTLASVINAGTAPVAPQVTGPLELTTTSNSVTYTSNQTVLNWTSNCNTCLTPTGTFNPTISGPGTFELCATTGSVNCPATACLTVTVTESPVDCTPDQQTIQQTLCPGEAFTFDNVDYTTAGTHIVNYINIGGCDSVINIVLNFHILPNQPIIESVCFGDSIEIDGIIYFENTTVIIPMTTQQGCTYNQTYEVVFINCDEEDLNVFIPNVFTPNKDNINDLWEIFITDGILEEGYIFNRWGQEIHRLDKNTLTWDGTTKGGNISPDGVYTYLIRVEAKGGVMHQYHGFVTIVR